MTGTVGGASNRPETGGKQLANAFFERALSAFE